MSKPDHNDPVPSWLEEALSSHLAPAAAPDGLWNRLESRMRPRSGWQAIRAVAATLILAGAAGGLWLLESRPHRLPDLAATALAFHRSGSVEQPCPNAQELDRWIATNCSPELCVRANPHSNSIRIAGASRVNFGGKAIAAVSYRVDSQSVTLLVAPADRAGVGAKRVVAAGAFAEGLRVLTWESGNHRYAMVSALRESSWRACMLCHDAKDEESLRAAIQG